jgi:aspartokinase/homoserine dehydrogenase 1
MIAQAVVVSAMAKVTNMLYSLVEKAESRDRAYVADLDALCEHHKSAAEELLSGEDLDAFLKVLKSDIDDLKAMLRAISIGTDRRASLSRCFQHSICVALQLY